MKWENYKQIYLMHSKTYQFKKKVEEAETIIFQFPIESELNINKIYCTCSAGKDSTVLSILCNEIFPQIKIFSEKDNFDYPDEIDYLKQLEKKYNWNLDIVNVKIDIDNIDICDEIHSRGVELSDNFFYSIIKKYKQDNNFKGVFLGLRKEESRARRINFYKKGHTYRKKDGEWVCNPLSNFTAKDIYAFLLSNNINPLRVYMHTHFCSPEKIRKSWYLPGARACEGQALILKYYYPQLFNILEQKFKRIRQYL